MWGKLSAVELRDIMWENHKIGIYSLFLGTSNTFEQEMTKINATKCICWNWKIFGSFLDRVSQSAIWNLRWPRIWDIAELIRPTEIILRSGSGKIILARVKSVAQKFSPIQAKQCKPTEQLKTRVRLLPHHLSPFSDGWFSLYAHSGHHYADWMIKKNLPDYSIWITESNEQNRFFQGANQIA